MIFNSNNNFTVNFIICGTQKGGTTALDHYMRMHSEVCMAKKKEVHFFDNDKYFLTNSPPYNKYHKFFDPKTNHKVIGESTPIYMFWINAMERIFNYNPNIKLIIILRNPIERAFSNWNMEIQRKREKRTFLESINDEIKQLNRDSNQNRTHSYLRRGFYTDQIKSILEIFKKKQLLCLKNENLRNKPEDTLSIVSDFLGISRFINIQKVTIHSRFYTEKLGLEEIKFLNNLFLEEIESLEKLLRWDLSTWKS